MRRFVAAVVITLCGCASTPPRSPTTQSAALPSAPPPHPEPPKPPALRLPRDARPTAYSAELWIDPASTKFRGVIDIDLELLQPTDVLWLNATDLDLEAPQLSQAGTTGVTRVVASNEDFVGLAANALKPGPAHLRVAYSGKVSDKDSEGIFREKVGDDFYVFSQFEATDARRAFPCFDEPSYKVPWQLTIHAPAQLVVASNMPVESEQAEGAQRRTRFAKSPPLSSYFVTFAVGNFEWVDVGAVGKNRVPTRIAVPKGFAVRAADAAKMTPPIVAELEQYFGIPYPYPKLDLVTVPLTVSWGAMENPGMVTFAQHYLLTRPSGDSLATQEDRALTIAHELAHQWFGDYVTLAWWDDVWLNESFADWMETRVVNKLWPEWHIEVDRVQRRLAAMRFDSVPSARRIRQPIETRDDIVNAFDPITYGKGGAIITMFEAWIGSDRFQAGVRRYLAAHPFGNATMDDFLGALSLEAGRDVSAPFKTFLDQPGVPLVRMKLVCEGAPRLELDQDRFLPIGAHASKDATWQVPVCVRSDARSERSCTLLTSAHGTLPLGETQCPKWLLPNADATGYYRALTEEKLWSPTFEAKALSVPERVMVFNDISSLVNGGYADITRALELVPRAAADENGHVVAGTIGFIDRLATYELPPSSRPSAQRFVRKTYAKRAHALGFDAAPTEAEDKRLLRPLILALVGNLGDDPLVVQRARALTDQFLHSPASVSPDIVSTVLSVAMRHGDNTLWERFHAALSKASERDLRVRLLRAMGNALDPRLVKKNFDLLESGELDPREGLEIAFSAGDDERVHQLIYENLKQRFDGLVDKLPRSIAPYLIYAGAGFCDRARRTDVEGFFRDRAPKIPGGPRVFAQVLDSIDVCIAMREKQEPALVHFFSRY